MIRTLLTTTAVALLLSAPAMAQNNAAPAANAPAQPAATQPVQPNAQLGDLLAKGYQVADTDSLATRLIGAPVYTSDAPDAERIGDINDIVLTKDGQIGAVVIGVGGFLGMGEKNVAVDFKSLQFNIAADNTERWIFPATKDQLSAAADFQWRDDQPAQTNTALNAPAQPVPAPAPAQPADQTAAATPANNAGNAQMNNAPAEQTAANNATNANAAAVTQGMQQTKETAANANVATPNAVDINSLTAVEAGAITADKLDDTDVLGMDNQKIAEVTDVVLTQDGKGVDALLIDFGGFLGIGKKTVAVGIDNLKFMQDQNGKMFVSVPFTKEQLDAAPQYDENTYAQNRDQQRLVVNNG
jgi:sporulation protein YlmC with PRC-barrel domain